MVAIGVALPFPAYAAGAHSFSDDWRQKAYVSDGCKAIRDVMVDAAPLTTSRGRPRDPSLEARVFDAAMALYAETGWAGFNFDAVARAAGVGKASIYRRWTTRSELLRQTFEARWYAVEAIDTGGLNLDLLALARTIGRTLTGPYGEARTRMALDAAQFPEVRECFRPYSEALVRQARAVVRRGVARGEIAAGVNPGLLIDLVVGGVTNHVGTTPPSLRAAMIAKMDDFTDELVRTVLRGVGARPASSRAGPASQSSTGLTSSASTLDWSLSLADSVLTEDAVHSRALLQSAEAARREGNPLALYDRARSAIAAGQDEPRFRYLQVLALAQMGDTDRAEQLYQEFGLGSWTGDEDALALQGRLFKDRALAAAGPERRAAFKAASQAYLRAYELRRGYFPGINAATTAWASGDRDAARNLAEQILAHPELNPADGFYAAASRAEALVLLGRPREAGETLAEAVATGGVGHGERASAFHQLEWLCTSAEISEADREQVLAQLRPGPVINFTGHMFRAGDAAEAQLAERIGAEIDALGAAIAYGALACGADIVIAEQILKRGGELHVVLPFFEKDFVEASVRPGGEAWLGRFEACMAKAASVTLATRMNYVRHDGQFSYGAQFTMGMTQLRAAQLAAGSVQLAVWDGQPARGDSGAAVDVSAWRALGLESRIIDPGPVNRRLSPAERPQAVDAPKRVVRAIIFSDYTGYSRLAEAAVPVFNREVMGRIGQVLNKHNDAVCTRNTWGDALYAIITEPAEAAEIVLEIVDSLKDVRVGEPGEPEGMRIGLHFGPVYQEIDPVTGRENFYGSEVTLTARIEPTVIPGEIYTTQAFAAMLAATQPNRFVTRYMGRVELAKGYGVAPIYQLERRRRV
jgi:AcrR family transcriptional regulator